MQSGCFCCNFDHNIQDYYLNTRGKLGVVVTILINIWCLGVIFVSLIFRAIFLLDPHVMRIKPFLALKPCSLFIFLAPAYDIEKTFFCSNWR